MAYQFPLTFSFKVIAFGPKITVTDASGQVVMFVHQKALKLKEDINIYTNKDQSTLLYNIQADRVIDFSAAYTMKSADDRMVGKMRRQGMKSLFKASYDISTGDDNPDFNITEDNPMVKFIDALLESIPVVGLASGYLFHPKYSVTRTGTETALMTIEKQPAFFEGKFELRSMDPGLAESEQELLVLSYIMMLLLERARG